MKPTSGFPGLCFIVAVMSTTNVAAQIVMIILELGPNDGFLCTGDNLTITCTPNVKLPTRLYFNSHDQSNNPKVDQMSDNSSRIIWTYSSVNKSDDGKIVTCRSTGGDPSNNKTIHVLFKVPKPIIELVNNELILWTTPPVKPGFTLEWNNVTIYNDTGHIVFTCMKNDTNYCAYNKSITREDIWSVEVCSTYCKEHTISNCSKISRLPSAVNLSCSFIDSSIANISWSPLPGTDITGYNISATSNGTATDYFTSDSYYVLLLTNYTVSSCVLNISVSGYNGLDGLINFITIPSFQPTAPVFVNVSETLNAVAIVDVFEECADFYSSLSFKLSDNNQTIIVNDFMVNESQENLIEIIGIVSEDKVYNLSVSFMLAGYQVENYSAFDTYGVESVTIARMSNNIVTCQFNSFSTDTGCTVQLVLQGTSTVQYAATFNRIGSIAEGSISIVSGGVYDILAFDEGSTVVAASLLGVDLAGIITTTTSTSLSFSTEPTTSVSVTSTITDPPANSPPQTTIIIVAVAILMACLIIIIIIVLSVIKFCARNRKKASMSNQKPPNHEVKPCQTNICEMSVSSKSFPKDSSPSLKATPILLFQKHEESYL